MAWPAVESSSPFESRAVPFSVRGGPAGSTGARAVGRRRLHRRKPTVGDLRGITIPEKNAETQFFPGRDVRRDVREQLLRRAIRGGTPRVVCTMGMRLPSPSIGPGHDHPGQRAYLAAPVRCRPSRLRTRACKFVGTRGRTGLERAGVAAGPANRKPVLGGAVQCRPRPGRSVITNGIRLLGSRAKVNKVRCVPIPAADIFRGWTAEGKRVKAHRWIAGPSHPNSGG